MTTDFHKGMTVLRNYSNFHYITSFVKQLVIPFKLDMTVIFDFKDRVFKSS